MHRVHFNGCSVEMNEMMQYCIFNKALLLKYTFSISFILLSAFNSSTQMMAWIASETEISGILLQMVEWWCRKNYLWLPFTISEYGGGGPPCSLGSCCMLPVIIEKVASKTFTTVVCKYCISAVHSIKKWVGI